VSSATAWPTNNGVLAQFTFQIQAGVTQQTLWPVSLTQGEVAIDNFDTQVLADTTLNLASTAQPAQLDPTASGPTKDGFKLVFHGQAGSVYVVEALDQIGGTWTAVSPQLTSTTGVFEFLDTTLKDGTVLPGEMGAVMRTRWRRCVGAPSGKREVGAAEHRSPTAAPKRGRATAATAPHLFVGEFWRTIMYNVERGTMGVLGMGRWATLLAVTVLAMHTAFADVQVSATVSPHCVVLGRALTT